LRRKFEVTEFVAEVTSRNWRLPLRPWSEFVERFTVPKFRSWGSVQHRVSHNFNYFQSNYLVLVGGGFLLFLIQRPWSLFELLAVMVSWVRATSTQPIMFGGRRVTRNERFVAAAGISILLPALTGVLLPLVQYVEFGVALCLVHAVFRHTNVRQKMIDLDTRAVDAW